MPLFEKISAHIWIMHADHRTDRPILAAIAGTRKTLLIDAGNSKKHAELFKEYLVQEGIRLPDLVALTHWHWDHSFGLSAWDAPAVAHAETSKALSYLAGLEWSGETLQDLVTEKIISDASHSDILLEYGNPNTIEISEPEIAFKECLIIDLGGVSCEIRHVGGDHSSDSCFIYVKEDRVLFLGDALAPSVYGGSMIYTASNFLEVLLLMYQYDAEIYVESHGVPAHKDFFLGEEIKPWEQLARLVDAYGNNPELILAGLKSALNVDKLPDGLQESLGYFLAGLKN